MVVTLETIASRYTSRSSFLPLVIKHRIANLLESFIFSHAGIVGQVLWLLHALHDRASFRDWFFLRLGFFSCRGFGGGGIRGYCNRRECRNIAFRSFIRHGYRCGS